VAKRSATIKSPGYGKKFATERGQIVGGEKGSAPANSSMRQKKKDFCAFQARGKSSAKGLVRKKINANGNVTSEKRLRLVCTSEKMSLPYADEKTPSSVHLPAGERRMVKKRSAGY